MITWGVLSAAMMFVRTPRQFYILRFLLGLAEAGFFPGIVFYLTCWYPSRLRARKGAWFMTAIALAGIVGNPMSGWIIDRFTGLWGLAGWKWLFLLEGIPSIIVGVWVIFYLDSGIDEARWLTDQQKALLRRNLELDDRTKQHARLADAFTSPRIWLLSAIYFCMMIGLYGVGFWLPTLVNKLGIEIYLKIGGYVITVGGYLKVGLISAIPYGIAALGMIALSRSSDITGERRLHTALTSVAGGIGLILCGVFANHPWISIAFLSLGTLGVLAAMPLFWTLPTSFLAGTAAAAGIGIVNSLGNLGGYVGPNIPVWIKWLTKNPAAPLYVIATFLFIGAALVLMFIPASPSRTPQ
jgi:MFS family permease